MRWKRVWDTVIVHQAELLFCIHNTVAGLLAFTISQLLSIPLHGLWAVLTSVVVTRIAFGESLQTTGQYIIGTVGGTIYAAIVGVLVPHVTAVGQATALALTVAPLSLAAAFTKSFQIAPFSSGW
jgi:uncharacterized membrane protein YccC